MLFESFHYKTCENFERLQKVSGKVRGNFHSGVDV